MSRRGRYQPDLKTELRLLAFFLCPVGVVVWFWWRKYAKTHQKALIRELALWASVLIAILLLLSSCAYTRVGDLNQISNRNIDNATTYTLLARDVTAKAKGRDSLEQAVDKATASVPGGEYMMNVKVYYRDGKCKVVGDVWGIQTSN